MIILDSVNAMDHLDVQTPKQLRPQSNIWRGEVVSIHVKDQHVGHVVVHQVLVIVRAHLIVQAYQLLRYVHWVSLNPK